MNPNHYTVALCTDRENLENLDLLKPSLILFSECDVRLFVGQADVFISDADISEDLANHLVSIGVSRANQTVIPDLESVWQYIQLMIYRLQLAKAKARTEELKTLDN